MGSAPRSRSLRRLYSHSSTAAGAGGGTAGASDVNNNHAAHLASTSSGPHHHQHHHSHHDISKLHPSLIAKYKKPGQSLTDAAAQAEWASKKWVWCPDPNCGYVSGWVVKEEGRDGGGSEEDEGTSTMDEEMSTVACVDDKTRTVPSMDLSKMNPPKFDRVEDIADLTFLNEASVVHNLRERYSAEMIYTYSGPFLVAVNPYRPLPIYDNTAVQLYKSRRREECPPHIFAVAEKAWQNMVGEREGQSILITGESGAGKTENTKKVIQYLTAIAAEASSSLPISGSASSFQDNEDDPMTASINVQLRNTHIHPRKRTTGQAAGRYGLENQIIETNPILEAFGNAQTVRNNNSSRFGKFVKIEFTSSGTIGGATIDWYLLEKSRVTARSETERSFHIFYMLLKGAAKELRKDLLLTGGPENYGYLSKSRLTVEGVDDHDEWRSLQHALDVVGFSASEQFDLFRIVASILHIGNIVVTADRSEQAYIKDTSTLEKICHLLGLDLSDLSKSLLRPKVKAGREWVTQARTKKQVEDELAALCKAIYEKSFGAMVDRINRALAEQHPGQVAHGSTGASNEASASTFGYTGQSTFIGVLDIAGFEIFQTNSFEQLCINYTNEKLQQFFNFHMFILEQEEYAKESIDWNFVNFGLDLQPTIDLIESNGNTTQDASSGPSSIGILSCLDEECIMPKATDATFTEKLNQLYSKKANRQSTVLNKDGTALVSTASKYSPNKFGLGFTISHYAGKVEYHTDGWLDKNKDPLNANITSILSNSTVPYIASLFEEYKEDDGLNIAHANLPDPQTGLMPRVAAAPKRRVRKGAFRTVAQRHKEQLNSLMAQLKETQPHFVRCIVPNNNKKPGQMDVPLVLDQLRCNGVLEGIRIARLGYPNRLPFIEFKQRYELLTPGIIPRGYMDGRKACQRITEALELDSGSFKIGLSKIFFKAGILAELEERRDELLYDVFTRFQAACKKSICQRRVRKQLNREAAIRTIQKNARIYLELKSWPWWMLYTKLRPLLAATRTDEELKRKQAELLLVQERALRDKEEKVKLEQLKISLEAEKKKVQDALDSERSLNLDKDNLLARSKEREAALEEELAAMQADLDTLDGQLERAMASQVSGEARYNDLKAAFDEATQHVAVLEGQLQTVKNRENSLVEELDLRAAEIEMLNQSKVTTNTKLDELKRKLVERDEDGQRARKRLETAHAELQGKLQLMVREKDNHASRASSLEADKRKADQQMADLARKVQDLERSLRSKESELANLQSKLVHVQKEKDAAVTDLNALRLRSDNFDKQLKDANVESSRLASAKERVESELDAMRLLVEAKASEDVKQKQLAANKESEIADLRQQVTSLSSELSLLSRQHADKLNGLRLELDKAKQAALTANTAAGEAMKQVKTYTKRLEDTERDLADAERFYKAAESDLHTVRAKQVDLEKALATTRSERDDLEAQTTRIQQQLQSLEDQTLKAEREKMAVERELDTVGERLEAEMTRRMQLEKSMKTVQNDIESLQMKIIEQDQFIKGLRRELKDKEAELAKSISLQDKTIVEHVHVLEEAKRYTDKQLSETQARLASVTQYSRTLEKTKARLQAELEDLTVQQDRERFDERAVEKQFRKLEEQAEKATKRLQQEERMRQVAERDVARLTAELQKLRSQPPSAYGGTTSIQRSKSAFENIPPSPTENGMVNGVSMKNRILRDLTDANKELEAGMRATLSGSPHSPRSLGRR